MKKSSVYIFALFILIIGCKTENKVDYRELNLGELFTYYLDSQDKLEKDSISERLYDSILIQPYRFFYSIETVDTNANDVKLQFAISDPDYFDNYCIKERNIYVFAINKYDSIKAEGRAVNSLDSLESEMKEYMTNPLNKENLPEKRVRVIEFFDTVLICRSAYFIYAKTVPDSLGNKTSWTQITNAINQIKKTTYSLRNELSLKTWNKEYHKLKLNQKAAICEYFPILIWIYPDRALAPPPPPPPPTSQAVIDIIESSEVNDDLFLEGKE